jgi:hypothetical protein
MGYGVYTMEYYSAMKRVKSCHLQKHRWNWKSLYQVKYDTETKTTCSHAMVEINVSICRAEWNGGH